MCDLSTCQQKYSSLTLIGSGLLTEKNKVQPSNVDLQNMLGQGAFDILSHAVKAQSFF